MVKYLKLFILKYIIPFFVWLFTLSHIVIIKIIFKSLDIHLFIPIVLSFIFCLIAYLKLEHLGKKNAISWYFRLFIINILFLSIAYYFFPNIIESLINYLNNTESYYAIIILHCFTIIFIMISNIFGDDILPIGRSTGSILQSNPTGNNTLPTNETPTSSIQFNPIDNNSLPIIATQTYNHRDLQCIASLNTLRPNDWNLREQIRIVEKLERQFFSFSLDINTNGEIAMFKEILKKNGVQDNWVAFDNSPTNKPKLYTAFHNTQFQAMVRRENQSLQLQNKFLATPNRSILN